MWYVGVYTYTHYITFHYITLQYITFHYIILQYITFHYITLHSITLHSIPLHYIHYYKPMMLPTHVVAVGFHLLFCFLAVLGWFYPQVWRMFFVANSAIMRYIVMQ